VSLADDLLQLAHLTRTGTDGFCRRSVSTAYYSCFHRLIDFSFDHVLREGTPLEYARSFDHKPLRKALGDAKKGNHTAYGLSGSPSPSLVTLASNFVEL
jgi:hypothetical protein